MTHTGTRTRHGDFDASGQRDVVVLDEHRVIQTKAMVTAAAHPHCIFLQRTQTGHGLARAGHARTEGRDRLRNRMRRRRHAAQMAQIVQRHALGTQDGTTAATNARDLGAGLQHRAIGADRLELHAAVHQHKRQTRQIQPREHTVLPRYQAQLVGRIGRHDGVGRQIAGPAQVFQQGHADHGLEHHIRQWRNRKCSGSDNAHFEYKWSKK